MTRRFRTPGIEEGRVEGVEATCSAGGEWHVSSARSGSNGGLVLSRCGGEQCGKASIN